MTTLTHTRTTGSLGLVGQLNQEWETMGSQPCPSSWASYPALAAHATLEDLLAYNRKARKEENDAILHTLLQLHHDGDTLAGRTVMQAMLGKLVRLFRTACGRGLNDPMEDTILAAWQVIATFPVGRCHKGVAGRIALDTLKHIPPAREFEITTSTGAGTDEWNPMCTDQHPWTSSIDLEGEDPTHMVTELLIWAQDTQTLSTADVQLLARKYLSPSPNVTFREIAEQTGEPLGTICSRHQRAVNKLVAAVLESDYDLN